MSPVQAAGHTGDWAAVSAGTGYTCAVKTSRIFSFGDNVTVTWGTDILARWPAFPAAGKPWRWVGHNEALGQWLIDIRPRLLGEQVAECGRPRRSGHPFSACAHSRPSCGTSRGDGAGRGSANGQKGMERWIVSAHVRCPPLVAA
jgi:hypothetical protein